MGSEEVLLGAGARAAGNPAHPPARRRDDPRWRRSGRWLSRLRQHAVSPRERCVLHRPPMGAHHRLEGRTRRLLRPGVAHARRRDQPHGDGGRRDHAEGRRRSGRARQLPPHPRRGLLRRRSRRRSTRPVLWRCGAGAQRLPRVRRVHDRLPTQRQEHPRQELPAPGRIGGRDRAPSHDGHARHASARRRLRDHHPHHRQGSAYRAHPHRRSGGCRGGRMGHPAIAAPHEG